MNRAAMVWHAHFSVQRTDGAIAAHLAGGADAMIVKAMLAFVRLPQVHRMAGDNQNVYMEIDGYKALLAVPLRILFEHVTKGSWWFHMMRHPANDRCVQLHNTLQKLGEVNAFDTHMRELYFHRFGQEHRSSDNQQPPMCKKVTVNLKKEIVKIVEDVVRGIKPTTRWSGCESHYGLELAHTEPDQCVILHT